MINSTSCHLIIPMASQSNAVQSLPNCRKRKVDCKYVSISADHDPGQIHLQHDYHSKQSPGFKAGPVYNYKPTALRSWFLLSVAAYFLACVAITEYAIRMEPTAAEVYNNTTLTTRNDIIVSERAQLGPISQNRRLSPKGMPRLGRDESSFLFERVPSTGAFMPSGQSTLTNQQSARPSSRTTVVSTFDTITTESLISITVPIPTPTDVKPAPGPNNPGKARLLAQVRKYLRTPWETTLSRRRPLIQQ